MTGPVYPDIQRMLEAADERDSQSRPGCQCEHCGYLREQARVLRRAAGRLQDHYERPQTDTDHA